VRPVVVSVHGTGGEAGQQSDAVVQCWPYVEQTGGGAVSVVVVLSVVVPLSTVVLLSLVVPVSVPASGGGGGGGGAVHVPLTEPTAT